MLQPVILGLDSSSNSSNIDESSSVIEDESSSSSLVPSSSSSSKTPSSSTSSSSSRPSSSSSSRPSSSSSSSSSSSTPSEKGVFSFDEAFLNTPQEIHTTNQKSYLNYSGDYYHITSSELTGFGMSGKSNVSAPNKVTLSWNYDAPTGKSVSKYSIIYGQKQDLSDGYQINGSTSKSISFYNPYLGDNYFKVVACQMSAIWVVEPPMPVAKSNKALSIVERATNLIKVHKSMMNAKISY